MITVRTSATLYHVDGGWFSANWHFSFDTYRDPENTSFGDLRVFNDDRLIPGAVWPMHPHRDIEGITYVAEGTFEHADSRGGNGVLPPGAVQRVTLGSGMEHSERNHSQTEPMRFVQLWILPARRGLEPSIEQREFTEEQRRGRLVPVLVPAAGFGGAGAPESRDAATVHQDASVYATLLDPGASAVHRFRDGFGGYAFVVHGSASLSGASGGGTLDEGDAAKVVGEDELRIAAGSGSAEALLVETKTRRPAS